MAERAILEVAHEDSRKDFRSIGDLLSTEIDKLEHLSREGKAITGTASGFEDLDTITGGFQPGNLMILAARPTMGKIALMANFAENAALDGQQGRRAVLARDVGVRARAALHRLAGVDPRRRPAQGQGPADPLAEDPAGVQPARRVAAVHRRLVGPLGARRARQGRRLAQQHADGLGLILIDYLQLMRAHGRVENRVEQIGQISRGLKTLARELEVPVIALSQLNRGVEQRTDKRPVLSDLRESGAIEQDADLVMFIYRDEYYDKESEREGIAELIISKHRNGGLGKVELTFQKDYPALHVLRRRGPVLSRGRLPRRPLRRLRLPLRRGDAAARGRAAAAPRGSRASARRRWPGGCPSASASVGFEREPVISIGRDPHIVRAVRRYVDRPRERLAEGRGIWFTGDVGTGKTTLAMLVSKAAMEADRTVAIYSLPRLLGMCATPTRRRRVLAQPTARPPVRRRPAAHRRRRRRADERVGARAALHDRQHALRGRRARSLLTTNLDRRRQLREQIGDAHGLADLGDLRRPAADVRRRPPIRRPIAGRERRRTRTSSASARPAPSRLTARPLN